MLARFSRVIAASQDEPCVTVRIVQYVHTLFPLFMQGPLPARTVSESQMYLKNALTVGSISDLGWPTMEARTLATAVGG